MLIFPFMKNFSNCNKLFYRTNRWCPPTREKPQEDISSNLEMEEETLSDFSSEIQQSTSTPINNTITGRRIVDIKHFLGALKNLKHKPMDCSFFDIDVISEKRIGFKSIFITKCNVCGLQQSISSESIEMDQTIEINKSAVSGTIAIGSGYSQLKEFCAALDIPCMSASTFISKERILADEIREAAISSWKEAAKEEAVVALEKGHVDADGIPLVPVTVDGAWSKRSYKTNYNAASGVGCIIGAHTKKVLYVGVKNKYCFTCKRKGKNYNHKCSQNWQGTSTSMEAQIIGEGFKSSLTMHGIKYNKIIGDGDSSVHRKIKELKPYGPNVFVEKIECRNHLLRNYCKKIREISNTSRLDGKLRLFLRNNILRFRTAVVSALRYYKNKNMPLHLKIEKLKLDILNSPKHILGHHDHCQEYFCNGPKVGEDNLYTLFCQSHVYADFEKIINRLAVHSSSLLHDVDTNHAESFNSSVNKLVGGKRINFSLGASYETRCLAASINFNSKLPFFM